MLSPRVNLGQPKAISVAPVGSKAFAAIWLLSSTIASLPAPATTCTGVQLGQGNSQLCVWGCFEVTFTETHKWLQWRWRCGSNAKWSTLETGKSQVTSLLTVLEEQRVAFHVVLGGFSQKALSTWCGWVCGRQGVVQSDVQCSVFCMKLFCNHSPRPLLLNGNICISDLAVKCITPSSF